MKITENEYNNLFPEGKRQEALKLALDTRKFEIELYWKRATYFWTFIAATLAGYSAIQASAAIQDKADLSVMLSCLGVLFSFGWHCVNRGSKQWQENWENHVDMLESDVVGPLFKTVLRRRKPRDKREFLLNAITGPWSVSVSGINQIISLFVVLMWLLLLNKSLRPFQIEASIDWEHLLLVSGTLLSCIGFVTAGRTSKGSHEHIADKRDSNISPRA